MRNGRARTTLRVAAFAAGILFVDSCSHAAPTGCDLCRTTAIANVFVRDSAGQPVARMAVGVDAYALRCAGDYLGGEGGWVTDTAGHTRLTLSSLYSPHTARCFLVEVGPLLGASGPVDTMQFADSVQFREEDGTPRDSVRFNVLLTGR